ncbi:immunoglobulin-like domain-containing protein [Pseudohaliea rubra]|uniref:immunoglobulin-like domain-containing protein n=1 Tax=Pseudohaliea rubra TaxID=475795 RepID=UPI000689E7B7|nr:immunoglobulin-like domain-containing protein [Pseudohaliea rubra]
MTLSADDVDEGDDITITATVDQAPETNLVITLSSDETITIAAGTSSASVTFANPNTADDFIDGETLTYSIKGTTGGNYEDLDTDATVGVVVSDYDSSDSDSDSYSDDQEDQPLTVADDSETLTEAETEGGLTVSGKVNVLENDNDPDTSDQPLFVQAADVDAVGAESSVLGTIAFAEDGSYTLTLNADGQAAADALDDGESLVVTADYTAENQSGEVATATLEVTIEGSTDDGSDSHSDDANDESDDDQQLPNGISHVKFLFTDDDNGEVYSVKIDNYDGDTKDPGDPQQYLSAVESFLEQELERQVTFDAYYIKAATEVYDAEGNSQGTFDNKSKDTVDPLSNQADYTVDTDDVVAPIALDLDGDGVEYLSRDAGVVFTDQVTGEAVNTAWVAGDDGLLVIDANNSGTVDEAREYVFTEWSETAETDMEAVAEVFDSNQNQMLDPGDEAWSQFAVWQDANSDGVTDAGELVSLDELGVESIALTYHDDSEATEAADGDVKIFGQAEVTWADGEVTIAEDTSFAINVADLIAEDDGAGAIDSYLQATFDGTNTIVEVSRTGSFSEGDGTQGQPDQTITFEGVDLVGDLSNADAIQAMIDAGKLSVDQ